MTTSIDDNYSDPVGVILTDDVLFATNTGYAWTLFGLSDFGSESVGFLSVVVDGIDTFTLNSDDGSYLFIDDVLVVDNGGPHTPETVSDSTFLTAGIHAFKVQLFEDFGLPSGVDLYLPDGVTIAAVPEPGSIALAGIAVLLLGVAHRRRHGRLRAA